MAPPIVSASVKKNKKSSLVLTLSSAGIFIGGGIAAYLLLTQGKPLSKNLPVGAKLIPQDALFAVSLSTDPNQWQKLREFGTQETQAEITKSIVQLRDRFLSRNGYNFQKDIAPWVGDRVTIAFLAPDASKPKPKPVATDGERTTNQQSLLIVLPIEDQTKATAFVGQLKALNGTQWTKRSYENITIKETKAQTGEKFSAALLDGRFLVVTDDPKATEQAINSYKGKVSLATTAGFTKNFSKVSTYQPFAQFYVNIPASAKLASASSQRQLPAQVLTQLQNYQALAGTITLESTGIRLKGISWLNPRTQRVLAVENKAGRMQNRLPSETLMMASGGNLQDFWTDYVLTSQKNPLSPVSPEQLQKGVKSLTNLDLEQDLLSWMKGEFSVSVIPTTPNEGAPENFRAALVFMVQVSDRARAEAALQQLDAVMQSQYQFQIQQTTVKGQPVVNWLGPFGTLTATHGWLNGDIAFLSLGAPIADKIISQPKNTLASSSSFQKTVPQEPYPTNGQFFLDLERATRNFPLPILLPNQKLLFDTTRSIGITSAVSDRHSMRYDIVLSLKKAEQPAPLPSPTMTFLPTPSP